jgi:phosphatidylserine decarboxylase
MKFHKEGYTSLALCILFIFVFNAIIQFYLPQSVRLRWFVYSLSFVLFVAVIYFFRSPSVEVITNEEAVLSPADGRIIAIEEVNEPSVLIPQGFKISIGISPLNVHVNRNPVKGVVKYFAADDNGTTIAVEKDKSTAIVYRQIKGFSPSRIITYIKQGDSVEQGAEFGFSKLGSRVDVYLPIGTKIDVAINDKVKGGQTILAEIKA